MSADLEPINLARAGPVKLGALEARPSTCELVWPDGREILQPRIMQVLVALASAGGEVVSRDELVRRCWDGRAVGDDAIHRCIAKLRQVGGAHSAFSVETVPRVGYRLVAHASSDRPSKAARADTHVLAVLPFDNLTSDPDLEFFSDGVSEEILSASARMAGLRVIGSTSSFSFRGSRKAEAGRALGATHVLDGSVRRGGARVRIAVQLTEAAGGQLLWRDSYDRELADVLALQDEIAACTGAALSAHFMPAETRPQQLDPQAYDLYLRALAVGKAPDAWAQEKAIAYLEAALAIEPQFVRARAALSLSLCARIAAATNASAPPDAFDIACARVRAEAERALAIDPANAEARFALLSIEPALGNWAAREAAIEAALAASPNAPLLRDAIGRHWRSVGRIREGFEIIATNYQNDPLSPRRMAQEGARLWMVVGDIKGARELFGQAAASAGADEYVWRLRLTFFTAIGDWDGVASVRTDDLLARFGQGPDRKALFQDYLALAKDRVTAFPEIDARLEARMRSFPFAVFPMFSTLASLGRNEIAISLLERAMALHPPEKLWAQWNIETLSNVGSVSFFAPTSAAARAHPRFLPLCAKIGLCAYWAETERWPDFFLDAPNRVELQQTVRALAGE